MKLLLLLPSYSRLCTPFCVYSILFFDKKKKKKKRSYSKLLSHKTLHVESKPATVIKLRSL